MGIFDYFLGYFLILDRIPPYPHCFFRAGAVQRLLSRQKFVQNMSKKIFEWIVAR